MSSKSLAFLMILMFGVFAASNSLYTIKESERGIKKQFGRIIDANLTSGLGAKIPVIHEVQKFDARVMGLDLRSEEYLTAEKKRLIVDAYVMWRIKDVELFYTAASGSVRKAEALLAPQVNEGLRNKFGLFTVIEVVSGKRDTIMSDLTAQLDGVVTGSLGIEILDIRVKKIELPPNVSESVYGRMREERLREAASYRSKGERLKVNKQANADRQVRSLVAGAYEKAEVLRGEGDATASEIYAKAYQANPEFFNFYRSLSAYRTAFGEKSDLLILSPDSEFFNYLKHSKSQ